MSKVPPWGLDAAGLGHFQSQRHLSVTTLGLGCGDLLGKRLNSHHMAALESGTWDKFCKLRGQVYTWSSDQ
eukprot:7261130-Heterocapsa_arctica.AAC.1